MNTIALWQQIEKQYGEPVEAIADFSGRAQVHGLWPIVVMSADRRRWSEDLVRGAIACQIERDFVWDRDWPAALSIILAPYPDDHSPFLDLLALSHRLLQEPSSGPNVRLVRRAATLLFSHALKSDPLVAFEAANVVGGLVPGGLVFVSSQERSSFEEAFTRVCSELGDPEIDAFLAARGKPVIEGSPSWAASPAEIEVFYAQVVSKFASYLETDEGLSSYMAHARATLRAFAESQEREPTVLGAGSIRVRPPKGSEVDAGALGVIQAFVDSIANLGGALFAQPMLLARGSVEIVFRFHAEEPTNEDEASLLNAADRIDSLLSPESTERIPPAVASLFDLVKRKSLSVDVSLRLRDGTVRTVVVDRAKVIAMYEHDTGVRRKEPDVGSIDVPQADDLDKVFKVAELLAAGQEVTVEDLKLTTKRQIDYYRHAARILGLVDGGGGVTAAGVQIAGLKERSARIKRAAVFFEQSPVGRAWLEWSGVESVLNLEPSTAEEFLAARTKVGGATRGRRAGTLQRWLEAFKADL